MSPARTLTSSDPASASTEHQNFTPGLTIEARDEAWLITHVARSTDGYRLKVRGLSDYVRDQPATFYTALDEITMLDPAT